MSASNSEARAVTAALAGKWMGSYGLCKCPAHHDTKPSLSVSQGRDGKLLLNCHGPRYLHQAWRVSTYPVRQDGLAGVPAYRR